MNRIECKIEERRFIINEPRKYFDQNIDNHKAHDKFFEGFTIIWRFFLYRRRFKAGESVWELALKIAYEWEDKNQNKRIHKGTPYYFWGVTCILNGDLEKGFLLMHQALEEDKRTLQSDTPNTPAYSFVTLDYENQDQFFRAKVEEIAEFLDHKLNVYRSSRGGTLTLRDLKSNVIEESALQVVIFYFIFELFRLKKLLVEIDQKLTQNVFSSLLQINTIFTLCLIIENVLKQKNPTQWRFFDHLKFLSSNSSLNLNETKIKELNDAFKNAFSNTLQNLLNSKYQFQDRTSPQLIEEDLAITYGFRNFGAHKVEEQPVVYQNFDEISGRILNALFFSVEKLYM